MALGTIYAQTLLALTTTTATLVASRVVVVVLTATVITLAIVRWVIGKTLLATVSALASIVTVGGTIVIIPVFNPAGVWLPLGRKYLHQIEREFEAERHD